MTEHELQTLQARVLTHERLLKRILPIFLSVLGKLDAKSREFEFLKAEIELLRDAVDRLDDYRGGPDQIPGVAA